MVCDTLGIKQIRYFAFGYRFWGIFWIGWVMKRQLDPTPLYFDNEPYLTIYPAEVICYVTIGLTRGGVMGRLQKYVEKIKRVEQ